MPGSGQFRIEFLPKYFFFMHIAATGVALGLQLLNEEATRAIERRSAIEHYLQR